MYNRLVFVCLVLVVLRGPDQLYAQFTDPRTYGNTPVGLNQLKLAYTYARADASIDTSLIISGAEFTFGHKQRWVFDLYANAYFYDDNTSYHGVEILRQQALPGLEGHVSYSCTPNLWVSLDTRYSFRGDTIVNGTDQNDAQQNFTLGSEANVSINPRNRLIFKFAKALVYKNGPSYTGFSLEYIFSWGKGYR
jgi:hypothetical protein